MKKKPRKRKSLQKSTNWPFSRIAAGVLGLSAGILGCYGAYTFAASIDGGGSYLALAAPLVAAGAALIPPLAEADWYRGHRLKSLLWWLVLIPAGATIFFASAERVHYAKAGAHAERHAANQAVARKEADLNQARAEAENLRNRAARNAALKEAANEATARVDKVSAEVSALQAKAHSEAKMEMPPWLLPLALDAIVFMSIWSALSGPAPVKTKRRKKASPKKPPANKKPVVRLVASK